MVVTTFGDILGLGVPELMVILVILLLIFGGKKLPELAKSVGSSIKEMRKGIEGTDVPKDRADTKSEKV